MCIRDRGIKHDLALIGLMSTIVCIVHALATILGDGKSRLVKHLFLFDILFDIVAAAILSLIHISEPTRPY